MHFLSSYQRYTTELWIVGADQPLPVRFILKEISEEGLRLFSPVPLLPGQRAKLFGFPVQVLSSVEVDRTGRIFGQQSFGYRLVLAWNVSSPSEQESLRKWLNEALPGNRSDSSTSAA